MVSEPNVGFPIQENGMIPCACDQGGAIVGTILEGVFVCHEALDENCVGHKYVLVAMAKDLVAHQKRMVLKGLTGPDEGKWYTCTIHYFHRVFKPLEDEAIFMGPRMAQP